MKAIITKINPPKISKYGGEYHRVFFKSFKDEKTYILDVYPSHYASKRFVPYIKEQAVFHGLEIYIGKFISGNSNFTFIGIRHEHI